MMTWEEFMERVIQSGIGYVGIDTDEDGRVVIYTDLFEKRGAGGNFYLARKGEFEEDANGEA